MHLCNRIEMTFLLARSGTKKRFALFNLSAMFMGISMASDSTGEAYEPEIQCFDLFRASKTRSSPYLHLSPLCPWGERNIAVSTYSMKPQICHIGTKSLESALPSWVFFQAFAPQTDTTNCAGAGSMVASRVRRDDCPALCRKTLKESNGKVGQYDTLLVEFSCLIQEQHEKHH